MNITKRIRNRINLRGRIGKFLRSRYSSFQVTRPYIIKVDEHTELDGKVAWIRSNWACVCFPFGS